MKHIPLTLPEANAFVEQHHRHSRPVRGHLFSIGAIDGDSVIGVAIVGRPVARMLQNGVTAEVLRCCTDGHRNACSYLYARAWRAARALGYQQLITYTRTDESGASLRGAGWRIVHRTRGRSWSTPSRPRVDPSPLQDKFRWEYGNGS